MPEQEEYELDGNEKATDLLPILFERGRSSKQLRILICAGGEAISPAFS